MLTHSNFNQNGKNSSQIKPNIEILTFQQFIFENEDQAYQPETKNMMEEFQLKYRREKPIIASKNCNFSLNMQLKNIEPYRRSMNTSKQQENRGQDSQKVELISLFNKFIVQSFDNIDVKQVSKETLIRQSQRSHRVTNMDDKITQNMIKDLQQTCCQTQQKFSVKENEIYSSSINQSLNFGSVDQKKDNFVRIKKYNIAQDYILKDIIGEGSYGTVYRSFNIHTNQVRAIKILKNKARSKNFKVQYFLQEFNILKKLDHPNIIKVFQVYQHSQQIYIVTQLCTGNSLQSYFRRKFAFTDQMKRQILYQIFKAVNYFNDLNIIHRDLKADNIIFTQEITQATPIEKVQIKIIDFGLAIQCPEKIMKDWIKIGTKSYLSPQKFQGIYSHKGDSWACGIIMHLLFFNSNPFMNIDIDQKQKRRKAYKLNTKQKKWIKLQPQSHKLIQQLLDINYVLRLDIKSALSSSYFRDGQIVTVKDSVKSQLLKCRQPNSFVDILQSYLSFTKVSPQKRMEYATIFDFINQSHSGQISPKEMSAFLQLNNLQEQTLVFKNINKSGKGLITFQEFIAALQNKKQLFCRQNIKDLFRCLDLSQNNCIEKEELKYFIKTISKQDLDRLYSHIKQKQSFINYNVLEQYILSNASF